MGVLYCKVWETKPWIRVWAVLGKNPKWYVVGWLGEFEWATFVAVDAYAYGKTGS